MNRIKLAVIVFLFLISGCSFLNYRLKRVEPDFNRSNQVFLESIVDSMELGLILKYKLPAGSRVVVRSIERPKTVDFPVVALIEDRLVESLVSNGFTVLERDEHAIKNLVQEGMSENNFTYISKMDSFPLLKTHLSNADFIINYRVLELGVLFKDADTNILKKREGICRLNIRVDDVKTGKIVFSKNITRKKADYVPVGLVKALSDFHYVYFPYKYPMQPKYFTPTVKELKSDTVTVRMPPQHIEGRTYFSLEYGPTYSFSAAVSQKIDRSEVSTGVVLDFSDYYLEDYDYYYERYLYQNFYAFVNFSYDLFKWRRIYLFGGLTAGLSLSKITTIEYDYYYDSYGYYTESEHSYSRNYLSPIGGIDLGIGWYFYRDLRIELLLKGYVMALDFDDNFLYRPGLYVRLKF